MLGNQPRLGAPLTIIIGHPHYAPWRLIEWLYTCEARAPAMFRKVNIFAACSGIALTLVAIAGSLWRARQCKPDPAAQATFNSHSRHQGLEMYLNLIIDGVQSKLFQRLRNRIIVKTMS